MKRIFLFLNLIFIICFSSYSVIEYNKKDKLQVEGTIITQKNNNDLVLLNNYKNKDIIYHNEILYYYEFVSHAEISCYELPCFSKDIKVGDILLENCVIEEYIIPYNLRVFKIMNDKIIVEKLDTTVVCFSFFPISKIQDYSNFDISIKYAINFNIEINYYDFKFNKDSGLYDVKINISNNGEIINLSNIRVYLTYHEKKEGLFINKSYLYQDNVGNYINKLINIRGTDYYKKIYVNVLEGFGNYYKISGDVNGNNVIIEL